VVWRSYELRPAGAPPMPPEYQARIKAMRPQFEAMAKQQYGVIINQGPSGINSRPALIGAKFAEAQGKGEAYHPLLLSAYWEQAQDISDLAILRGLAEAAGLDGDAFMAALDDVEYEQQVDADILLANELGINGVPALIFERKYYVAGAQPYDVLVQAVEQISAQNPNSDS
jgi:predicted DsbA family dithiol-disulfide isomerase